MREPAHNRGTGLARLSIRTKLLVVFVPLLVLACAALTWVSSTRAARALEAKAFDGLHTTSSQVAALVEARLDGEIIALQGIANRSPVRSMVWEEQLAALQQEAKRMGYENMAVVDMQGNARYLDGETANLSDRLYIQEALAGNSVVSPVLVSRVSNTAVMPIAVPILNRDGERVAALMARRPATFLADITNPVEFGRTGQVFAVDSEGVLNAHRDEQLVLDRTSYSQLAETDPNMKPIADFVQRMTERGEGEGQFMYRGSLKLAAYHPVDDMPWTVGVVMDHSELTAKQRELLLANLWVALTVLGVGLAVLWVVAGSIARPVQKATAMMKDIAEGEGDLSARLPVVGSDEVAEMSRWFNRFVDNVESVVAHTQQVSKSANRAAMEVASIAEQVGSASTSLAQGVERVSIASEQQAEQATRSSSAVSELTVAIDQVAMGAQQTAALVEDSNRALSAIAGSVERSAQDGSLAETASQQVRVAATAGEESVKSCIKAMERIEASSGKASQLVEQLGEASAQIGTIVAAIDDIAEQTNLLALNAAIEAARAGEHGRGFAVVADEVRKLAERSSEQTKEITSIVGGIQELVTQAVNAMRFGSKEVADGNLMVAKAEEQLSQIQAAVEESSERIVAVTRALSQVNAQSAAVLRSFESLSAIAEETSASTQQMTASATEVARGFEQVTRFANSNAETARDAAAATEEQAAAAQEMGASAAELQRMVSELVATVGRFRVRLDVLEGGERGHRAA